MHQEGKRIDWVSIQMKHYESNVCNFVPVLLVVQTCVSLGERLHQIEEISNHFREWKVICEVYHATVIHVVFLL